MEEKHIIPTSTVEFEYGTRYQIMDPITFEWSEPKTISKLCSSIRIDLRRLIKDHRIRIVRYD